jgi:hypothetical protein
MTVVLVAATLWIALSVALALSLGRTVRLAEAMERDGTDPLSIEPFLEDAPPESSIPRPVRAGG